LITLSFTLVVKHHLIVLILTVLLFGLITDMLMLNLVDVIEELSILKLSVVEPAKPRGLIMLWVKLMI